MNMSRDLKKFSYVGLIDIILDQINYKLMQLKWHCFSFLDQWPLNSEEKTCTDMCYEVATYVCLLGDYLRKFAYFFPYYGVKPKTIRIDDKIT